MPSQDETKEYRTRRRVSEISVILPFFGKVFLVGGQSLENQIKQAQKRLATEPNNVKRRLGLALLLTEAGHNQEAMIEWTKAHLELPFDDDVRDDPVLAQENAYARYAFGIILYNTGAVKEAILELDKAADLDHCGIGQLAKDKKEAIQSSEASE